MMRTTRHTTDKGQRPSARQIGFDFNRGVRRELASRRREARAAQEPAQGLARPAATPTLKEQAVAFLRHPELAAVIESARSRGKPDAKRAAYSLEIRRRGLLDRLCPPKE